MPTHSSQWAARRQLSALPLRSCHWMSEAGGEQLLLLLGEGGELLHCAAEDTTLHMHACSMHALAHAHELMSDAAESVVTAIACWVWAHSVHDSAPAPHAAERRPRAHI